MPFNYIFTIPTVAYYTRTVDMTLYFEKFRVIAAVTAYLQQELGITARLELRIFGY